MSWPSVPWRPYAIAVAGVLALSVVIGVVIGALRITHLSMLYLIVVLAVATKLGRGPAIFASVAAVLVYDWFFTAPYHQLAIEEPDEWISLGLFLVTAVIASELAANERARAEESGRREREARLLFDTLRLLGLPDLDDALRAVAEHLCRELRLEGAAILISVGGRTHRALVGAPDAGLEAEVLDSGAGGGTRPRRAKWIRLVAPNGRARRADLRRSEIPVGGGSARAGKLTLVRRAGSELTAEETRALAVIAASLDSLSQRTELAEATTRAEVLRRADELKSALLAAVSHDLRTPLASIIASAASLRQPDVQWTEAERRVFVSDIETEARRLSRIVDNLLDLSRLESGALRPERDWYDVATLVGDVVGRLRPLAAGHDVAVDVPDDLAPAYLDHVEIDQVVSNLVENALRHTPPGTAVRVSARAREDALEIAVDDWGPGIDARDLPRVFEPFAVGRSSGRHGAGLGLAVARRLVEAHGGTLVVENQVGGGASFRLTLPGAGTRPAVAP